MFCNLQGIANFLAVLFILPCVVAWPTKIMLLWRDFGADHSHLRNGDYALCLMIFPLQVCCFDSSGVFSLVGRNHNVWWFFLYSFMASTILIIASLLTNYSLFELGTLFYIRGISITLDGVHINMLIYYTN
jgi:hypothetical protein